MKISSQKCYTSQFYGHEFLLVLVIPDQHQAIAIAVTLEVNAGQRVILLAGRHSSGLHLRQSLTRYSVDYVVKSRQSRL